MALEIALRAVNLVVKAEELSAQVTAAVGGNREEFKELRKDLLQLEKDRK